MNETHYFVGMEVLYYGDTAENYIGQTATVTKLRHNNVGVVTALEAEFADGFRKWSALWAWNPVPKFVAEYKPTTDFMNPHSASIEVIVSEIKRLEEQLAKLKAAKEVLEKL
jgi:hypothetical protein